MIKRQIIIWLTIAILIGVALIITSAPREETIKIGAILPLSGDAAFMGQNSQRGIELAVEEINAEGGVDGKNIEIIYEDDQAITHNSINSFNKLKYSDGVSVIVGPSWTQNVLALAPLMERLKEKILLITPTASGADITRAGDYIFRTWPSDAVQDDFIANKIYALGYHNIAVFYVNNDWGLGHKHAFYQAFLEQGGKVKEEYSVDFNAKDFHTQIIKAKELKIDAIFELLNIKQEVLFAQQCKELGLDVQIFASSGFEDAGNLELGGNEVEGIIYSYPAGGSDAFIAKFEEKYGTTPGLGVANAYDAIRVIANAMNKVGTSPENIKNYLYTVRDYQGASGNFSFDENGDLEKEWMLKTVENGRFIPYDE